MKSCIVSSALLESGPHNPSGIWGYRHQQLLSILNKPHPTDAELVQAWLEECTDLHTSTLETVGTKELNRLSAIALASDSFAAFLATLPPTAKGDRQEGNLRKMHHALLLRLQKELARLQTAIQTNI